MDISALTGLLRRRFVAIVLCVLAGVGAGVATWKQAEPVYQASSSVLLGLPGAQNTSEAVQGLQVASQVLQSYSQIVSSRSLAGDVKTQLGLPESIGAVQSKLSAVVRPQTLFLDVRATDRDPVRARALADAATVAFTARIAALQKDRSPDTAVTATVIDDAQRGKRISPRPKLDVGVGLGIGLLAGLTLALLLDALDRSVKTAAQLSGLLDVPVLGVVPKIKRRTAVSAPLGHDAVSEAYRALRTAVSFVNPDSPLASFAVTSPSVGEGKTTTSANLAIALAESGERVVLVDADLRRAGLAGVLGIEGAVGLSNVIVGDVSLDDALQEWGGLLHVLPAGTTPPNPSELLGSNRMAELVDELHERFDVAVFDCPPSLPVTDAVVLSRLLDGLVLVVRAGRTSRPSVTELRQRLDTVQAPVLGCVLNATPASQVAYGYYRAPAT